MKKLLGIVVLGLLFIFVSNSPEAKADIDIFNMNCYKLNSEENYVFRKSSYSFVEK